MAEILEAARGDRDSPRGDGVRGPRSPGADPSTKHPREKMITMSESFVVRSTPTLPLGVVEVDD
jgi:hypothetical protein